MAYELGNEEQTTFYFHLGKCIVLNKPVRNDDVTSLVVNAQDVMKFFRPFESDVINGLLLSPLADRTDEGVFSVRLLIFMESSKKPLSICCPSNSNVGRVLRNVCRFINEQILTTELAELVFQVKNRDEYLWNETEFGAYEYVQWCKRMHKEVCLKVVKREESRIVWPPSYILRPKVALNVDDHSWIVDTSPKCKFDKLIHLLKKFEDEAENSKSSLSMMNLETAVKSICIYLSCTETPELLNIFSSLQLFLNNHDNPESYATRGKALHEKFLWDLGEAVALLVHEFSRSFPVDFSVEKSYPPLPRVDIVDATGYFRVVIVNVFQIPTKWASMERFCMNAEVCYGETVLQRKMTEDAWLTRGLVERVTFDKDIVFDQIPLSKLPRESRIYFTLLGDSSSGMKSIIGKCGMNLFSFTRGLNEGYHFLSFQDPSPKHQKGQLPESHVLSKSILLVKFPYSGGYVLFPNMRELACKTQPKVLKATEDIQNRLMKLSKRSVITTLEDTERKFLWRYRNVACEYASLLPLVLRSVESWDASALQEIYCLLERWGPISPSESLALLGPYFPDSVVRKLALEPFKNMVEDELSLYLPQLVQSLRFETCLNSTLALFLLEKCRTSARLAHCILWLLECESEDETIKSRLRIITKVLFILTSQNLVKSFEGQKKLSTALVKMNDYLSGDPQMTLRGKIRRESFDYLFDLLNQYGSLRIPIDPALLFVSVKSELCTVYPSKNAPMKLLLETPGKGLENLECIFKVGDDLRQDLVVMNSIRLMDKLWLRCGVDLKMYTYRCVPTGKNKGFLEFISNVLTLRKIQTHRHGVTGSFNEKTIDDWLQAVTQEKYTTAVDNFTRSCAGYCVAMYVLGVGDRHNDNILIKASGHVIHIDFGKILGSSEMIAQVKRDRVPFILTKDMMYVIKKNDLAELFMRLCKLAYSILRSHGNLLLNYLNLMTNADIEGIDDAGIQYVAKTLCLELSEDEADAHFVNLINESLEASAPGFNFFIHNLAQLRNKDNNELSPEFDMYGPSIDKEGLITGLEVIGLKKTYDTHRQYVHIVEVKRQYPPVKKVFRTYDQFVELCEKLTDTFPDDPFHRLPRRSRFGRQNVYVVAEKHQADVVLFLSSLMEKKEFIRASPLVCKFFATRATDDYDI